MNTNTPLPIPGWQTLGELELPVGASTGEIVHAWLAEALASLNLSTDFLERVLRSAQESAGHALQPNAAGALLHIHFFIPLLLEHDSSGKSWGFFHIKRIETRADDVDARHHAIDFYLYVEGE
jgi:hypothetical protein